MFFMFTIIEGAAGAKYGVVVAETAVISPY